MEQRIHHLKVELEQYEAKIRNHEKEYQ